MGYFKFDKLDKIVISFSIIIVTFFCVFNTFCFASYDTNVSLKYLFNCSLKGNPIKGNIVQLTEGTSFAVYEIPVYYGYNYNFLIEQPDNFIGTKNVRLISFNNKPDIDSLGFVEELIYVQPGTTNEFNFTVNDVKQDKIYLCLSFNNAGITPSDVLRDVTVTTDYVPNGLGDSINLLVKNVSFSNIWTVFEKSIPFVLVVVLFSLGVWFIRHNIIEHSKGRDF